MTFLDRVRYDSLLFDAFEQNLSVWTSFLKSGERVPRVNKESFDSCATFPEPVQQFLNIAQRFDSLPLLGPGGNNISLIESGENLEIGGFVFSEFAHCRSTRWGYRYDESDGVWPICIIESGEGSIPPHTYLEHFLLDWAHCHMNFVWVREETDREFERFADSAFPLWTTIGGSQFWFNPLGITGQTYVVHNQIRHCITADFHAIDKYVGRPYNTVFSGNLLLR